MTEKLYSYRDPTDEKRLLRWFEKGEAPAGFFDEGVLWELVPDRPRETTMAMKETIHGFASIQLPKWWPWAPRHDPQGRCVFYNRQEAEEACRRATAAGEPVAWDY